MTDDPKEFEGFRIIEGGVPPDDDAVVPGRSVFGDDEILFDDEDDALPHWTEPGTGAVPIVGGGEPDEPAAVPFAGEPRLAEADDLGAWSGPQWADEPLPVAEEVPVGASEELGPAADDFFGFDEEYAPGRGVPVAGAGMAGAAPIVPDGGERDMGSAVVVGVALAALILGAMSVGPAAAMVVVTIALGLAAVELFNALRMAGYQPAVLLGLAACVTLPLAVYWRGEQAIPVVLVLSVIFGGLWYLTGVGPEGPLRGLASSLLGIVWIGVLGSYAAVMLAVPGHGTGLLTAAIVVTVAYDVGGLFVGRAAGRTPLSPASPNKTVEGLIGGCAAAVGVGVAMGVLGKPAPFADLPGGFLDSLALGVAAAVVAPLGDLTESLLKRDLGVKDMGSLLPGHGGVLDRFDSMLFVLPTTWFVARVVLF